MIKSRSSRRLVALVAAFAAGVTGLIAPAAGAGAAGPSGYVKPVNVCSRPAAGHASCFAMRLKSVPRGTAGARPRATSTKYPTAGPAGGYTPTSLAKAYDIDPTASTGSGMTVAIVDAYANPTITADLNFFDHYYGIAAETSTSFQVRSQRGNTDDLPATNTDWAVEEALDVEAVRATCRKCKIVLIEADSNAYSNFEIAENEAVALGAKVISNSWGGDEESTDFSALSSAFNHPGVAITASTGDHGWSSWDFFNENEDVNGVPSMPATLKTVTAVGGTSLWLNPDGTRASETVWNENGPKDVQGYNAGIAYGATGGGCSTLAQATTFQQGVATWANTGCGTHRLAADVSADADPYTGMDVYTQTAIGGWETIGGTSLASPLIAGMWGDAGGPGATTYPTISLYGHRRSTSGSFYDVTVGGNGACGGVSPEACENYFGGNPNTTGYGLLDCAFAASGTTPLANRTACNATPSFDGPSGLGTPNGLVAFKAMKPTAVIASPGTVTHGVSKTFDGTGSSDPFPGGSITSYAWLWGDHTAGSSGAKPSHKYAAKGTYTVTLTVTDSYHYTGTTTRKVTVK